MAFQLCKPSRTQKGEDIQSAKRAIKNSVWSHLYKTQKQDDEAIGWDQKEGCQVKETIERQSNILTDSKK